MLINTPGFNILDPPNLPAVAVDTGTDTVNINAPLVTNEITATTVEATGGITTPLINGYNPALYEFRSFNTSNISPGDWVTLAQTGDGFR